MNISETKQPFYNPNLDEMLKLKPLFLHYKKIDYYINDEKRTIIVNYHT